MYVLVNSKIKLLKILLYDKLLFSNICLIVYYGWFGNTIN